MNKYGAIKTTVDGITFASKREAFHYGELRIRERAGEISHLECHPKFELKVNGRKIGTYTADFSFFDLQTKQRRVIDVKSKPTAKGEAFRLRKKLFEALYGYDLEIWL